MSPTTSRRLPRADLERLAHRHQVSGGAVVEVRTVGAGDDQHLVGRPAPERTDHQDPLVGIDHPVTDVLLGVHGGAQQAPAGKSGEAGLLLDELAGDE